MVPRVSVIERFHSSGIHANDFLHALRGSLLDKFFSRESISNNIDSNECKRQKAIAIMYS